MAGGVAQYPAEKGLYHSQPDGYATGKRRREKPQACLLLRLLIAQYNFGARSIEACHRGKPHRRPPVLWTAGIDWPSCARIHADWRVDLERRLDQVRKRQGLPSGW